MFLSWSYNSHTTVHYNPVTHTTDGDFKFLRRYTLRTHGNPIVSIRKQLLDNDVQPMLEQVNVDKKKADKW